MTIIKKLVEQMSEEICSAKDYAEKYVEARAENNSMWANRYKEMAQDELKHAMYIHEQAVAKVDQIRQVYEPSVEMEEKWDKAHKEYVEKVAWVKTMLSM